MGDFVLGVSIIGGDGYVGRRVHHINRIGWFGAPVVGREGAPHLAVQSQPHTDGNMEDGGVGGNDGEIGER